MARGMKKRMENKRILRGVDEKDSSFSSPFILGVTINLCVTFGVEVVDSYETLS